MLPGHLDRRVFRRRDAVRSGRMGPNSPHIAVIGAGSASPEQAAAAEAVGRGLAEAGAVLVCGGRGGVMEAACRGAVAAGGETIGILPGHELAEANRFCTRVSRPGSARPATSRWSPRARR